MNKTIIVSNRLPLQLQISEEGEVTATPSVGGLATGMKTVHKDSNGIWIGWSGVADEELTPAISKRVNQAVKNEQCVAVPLNKQDLDNYYFGFSNRTLWPLFHYFLEYTEFDNSYWESYVEVNKKFAEVVISEAKEGDTIWIHDYQLLLLPALVKEKLPSISIGFFLHIPFPSYEIFRTFPVRKEILEGMLGADLLGFHTYDYERHFLSSIKRILRLEVNFNEITYQDRIIKVDSFPMGIDYKKFENAAQQHTKQSEIEKSEIQKRLDQHLQTEKDVKMILSIDRMDYTKGIPNRIRAFEYFLRKYPQFQEKIRLIMLAVPSRSEVPQYQLLKKETDELVGRVNGEFSTVSWTPIWYFYRTMPFDNLIDLYTSSHVALITPVRDGMNLVAKEYIATRTHQDGVLVLSEMTGASKELDEALLINPYNFSEIADAIKQAIEMPKKEQKRRMMNLQKRVSRYSVEKWAEEFMNSLKNVQQNLADVIDAELVTHKIALKFKKIMQGQDSKVVFLDYDGTLVGFQKNPQDATPDKDLKDIICKLSQLPNIEVVIISGRDKKTLQEWMGDLPVSLVSDHGVSYRPRGEAWQQLELLKTEWKQSVIPVIEKFVDNTPGSILEEKKFSVAWHFRKADPELAERRLVELKTVLTSFISNTDLTLLEGNQVIELKSSKVSKGRASSLIYNEKKYDHVFAMGDDWTDEFMFEDLPEKTFSIKVGLNKTIAKYYINSSLEVRRLLSEMVAFEH